MHKQLPGHLSHLDRRQQGLAIAAFILVAFAIILFVTHLAQPARSVAAYCQVYAQEKTRLSAMSNQSNPYPSGVFDVSVTDAGQIATSLGRLNHVAPAAIEPEVSSLQKLYQDIHTNPSHAISDSLNGGSLDDNLKAWTQQHCQHM